MAQRALALPSFVHQLHPLIDRMGVTPLATALRTAGVAVTSPDVLRDRAVLARVFQHPDLLRSFVSVLQRVAQGEGANSAPIPTWPEAVQIHFQPPETFGTIAPWSPKPEGFDHHRALRAASERRHGGKLVYPRNLLEDESLMAEAYAYLGMGQAVGRHPTRCPIKTVLQWLGVTLVLPEGGVLLFFDPSRVGFSQVYNDAILPGDLVLYDNGITRHPAVVTKTSSDGYPVEVLLPWGFHLFRMHPSYPEDHKTFWRPATAAPRYLLSDGDFHEVPVTLQHEKELRQLEQDLAWDQGAFRILSRQGIGLSQREWSVICTLANGDWVNVRFSIGDKKPARGRTLRVGLRYVQALEDPPDFYGVAERALLGLAKGNGFAKLEVTYLGPDKKQIPILQAHGYRATPKGLRKGFQ